MIKKPANHNLICPECGQDKDIRAKRCHACAHIKCSSYGSRIRQVITALSEGKSIKEIAFDWNRTRWAVERAWAIAKARYGFQCYQDATRYAIKQGWVGLDGAPAGK